MKSYVTKGILFTLLWLLLSPMSVSAASTTAEMDRFPNVTLSPDGSKRAWTVDLGDRTDEKKPYEYTVDLKATSSKKELQTGEHYYKKKAEGAVTIGKWVVKHTPGQCVHDTEHKDSFAGFTYTNPICWRYYNNGWFAYCADCGDPVYEMLIYGRESTIRQITSMPASSIYVHLCPYCTHLEQGTNYQHYCVDVSVNRYRVTYRPNAPQDGSVSGYMAPTMHMYGNGDSYNGESAEELGYTDRYLRKNSFSCRGYLFRGWNTEPDGSGTFYADGEEILNLTDENDGIVKLYAQWERAESTLQIDGAGGTYAGQEIYEKTQEYGSSYLLDTSLITPPAGYTVSFETNGGSNIPAIHTEKEFFQWEIPHDLQGALEDGVYQFLGDHQDRDTLIARYANKNITLPDSLADNLSLVGWYTDAAFTSESYVGKPGDKIAVEEDTILYAKWEALTLWADDDYVSHGGVGAVDLRWEQKDGKSKYYKLYQSTDKINWQMIFTGSSIGSTATQSKTYTAKEQGESLEISSNGFYTLTAYGAKGGDHGSYTGGAGAGTTASYWFKKGDVLQFYPGSMGQQTAAGTNGRNGKGGTPTATTGSGGGAATEVTITRDGVTTTLMIAGGGGGANAAYNGGAGSASGTGTASLAGADGAGGGGGGAKGGTAGAYTKGTQTSSVQSITSRTLYMPYTYESVFVSPYTLYATGSETINGKVYYKYREANLGTVYSINNIICFNLDGNAVSVSGSYLALRYVRTCSTGNCLASGYGYHHTLGSICNATIPFYQKVVTQTPDFYTASTGGGSYINTAFGCQNPKATAGENAAAGKVVLTAVDVGYHEASSLEDVLAKDHAAPGEIGSFSELLVKEDICRISLQDVTDYGTVYYHKAESYDESIGQMLVESNITENELTSGVTGYRYYADDSVSGTVTQVHTLTEMDWVDVKMQERESYLHVAAVDVAGNIGPTRNIPIRAKEDAPNIDTGEDYVKNAPLKTGPLVLLETDFVHAAGEERYFVKADGMTEHTMTLTGYVDGKATNQYQVDWLQMESYMAAEGEWYRIRVPRADATLADGRYRNEDFVTDASKEVLAYLVPAAAQAERLQDASVVNLEQHFVITPETDGKQITVYPRAMAEFLGKVFLSEEVSDRANGLVLIPDAKAPVVYGVEALERAGNLDMTTESKEFTVWAEDDGSGIRELAVTIVNQDNLMKRTYSSKTGVVTIVLQKEDYLFLGDFEVFVEASDQVGNVSTMGNNSLGFSLEADLKRSRIPYEGDFKAGDGGVLTILTGGYVERLVVTFPEALLALEPTLNREYVYEYPEGHKTEIYEFNIPLETPDGTYKIQVEAWKNGRKLTEELTLPVQTQGSILDEFRTRIRDNGV